jgi:hypothetical protein
MKGKPALQHHVQTTIGLKNHFSYLSKPKFMKAKAIIFSLCVLCVCTAFQSKAQQQNVAKPNNAQALILQKEGIVNYTFHIFQAPNKTYGYDIFANGRLTYHQPAFSKAPIEIDAALTKEDQANRAAMFAIDKIRKGKDPELSNEELKAITAH